MNLTGIFVTSYTEQIVFFFVQPTSFVAFIINDFLKASENVPLLCTYYSHYSQFHLTNELLD
jgi:hypothetical protein